MFSNSSMDAAAAQVRGIDVTMRTAVEELTATANWSGADAERFRRDWHDQVSARLQSAAAKLDGLQFSDFGL